MANADTNSPGQTAPAWLRHLLAVCVLLQGLSGIAGGVGLTLDPTGKSLQIPIEWLAGSPFSDFLVPGLILGLVLGVFPVVIAVGLWMRKRWAGWGSVLVGLGLIIWILVEVLIIGYQPEPPLQAIYGTLGVVILALSLLVRPWDRGGKAVA